MATDTLEIFGTEYTGVTGIKATDSNSGTKTYIRPQGTKSITQNGTGIDVAEYASVDVSVSGGGSVTWETIYDGTATIVSDSPNYIVINNWAPTNPIFADGQTWRVTWNGTEYVCPAKTVTYQGSPMVYIGNSQVSGVPDTSNEPFLGYMTTSTQLAFVTTDSAGSITLKMELQHDTSATLITKSITANGTYDAEDDDADGYSSVTVNVSGGITTQIVLPEQSITATTQETSGYYSTITNLISEELADDTNYIITLDGTKYLCHSNYIASWTGIVVGDANAIWGNPQTAVVPFMVAKWDNNQTQWCVTDNSAHTVKIERVVSYYESVLTTKSITANGTYTASSDSADGYSSVTVNVPTGTPTIQSLTVNPSTTQQTFDASGVDGYKPVTVNAMPSGTAGTPTATKGTVSNHSVSVTPSVTNTTGYITGSTKTGTAVTVSASELVSGTLSLSDNGTADCTDYASVNVNIPFVTYYTGSSTPSSSLGANGDIYLKTV